MKTYSEQGGYILITDKVGKVSFYDRIISVSPEVLVLANGSVLGQYSRNELNGFDFANHEASAKSFLTI